MAYTKLKVTATDTKIVPFTAEMIAETEARIKLDEAEAPTREMEAIRKERDRLLASTDWTGNPDVTMSDAMKTYRQMLRDIPASNTVYEDVNWGTKP